MRRGAPLSMFRRFPSLPVVHNQIPIVALFSTENSNLTFGGRQGISFEIVQPVRATDNGDSV
jgi:hypothetical protein